MDRAALSTIEKFRLPYPTHEKMTTQFPQLSIPKIRKARHPGLPWGQEDSALKK
jgi:hypothetical protein